MSGTARDLLTWAASQVGTLEKPPESNNNPYAAIAHHANGQPWCATFVVAGWKANAVPLVAHTDTAFTPSMHDAFKAAGRLFDIPRAGDVGFKFYPDLGRIGHVFFVEKVVGDFVKTIEGNTNTDGSRTGLGVFRQSRRWRNGTTSLRGFGRPTYAAAAAVPTVKLSNLQQSSFLNAPGPQGSTSHPADVRIVEAALVAEGLLSAKFAGDGSFGTETISAYKRWQRSLGFSGADADGHPGGDSLSKLGRRHGFAVVP